MDAPWRMLAPVDKDREYLALLSYLPLKKFSKIPSFFRFSFQIQRQVRQSPGAIGYSLRAKPLSRKFWTLSVWEDERALFDFVAKAPHGEAMKAFGPHMGQTRFSQWKVPGSAVPPNWDDAIRRMSQER
jgi:quinol monooxygenase YgiN